MAGITHNHHECGGIMAAIAYFAADYPIADCRIISGTVATTAPYFVEAKIPSRTVLIGSASDFSHCGVRPVAAGRPSPRRRVSYYAHLVFGSVSRFRSPAR